MRSLERLMKLYNSSNFATSVQSPFAPIALVSVLGSEILKFMSPKKIILSVQGA